MRNVHKHFCHTCEYGQVERIIRYRAYGSSIDWSYDTLKVEVPIAVEIFNGKRENGLSFFGDYEEGKEKRIPLKDMKGDLKEDESDEEVSGYIEFPYIHDGKGEKRLMR